MEKPEDRAPVSSADQSSAGLQLPRVFCAPQFLYGLLKFLIEKWIISNYVLLGTHVY